MQRGTTFAAFGLGYIFVFYSVLDCLGHVHQVIACDAVLESDISGYTTRITVTTTTLITPPTPSDTINDRRTKAIQREIVSRNFRGIRPAVPNSPKIQVELYHTICILYAKNRS